MVPIRGSKQQGVGGGRPGNPGGRKRKSVSSKRQRWSDDDEEEDVDEFEEGEEDGEEEEEAGGGGARRSSRRRRRRRVAEYDEGDDDVSLSSGGEGSQGEGRSAGTTTASPLAHLATRGRGSSSLVSVEEREPLALAELSRRLTLEGLPIDAATMAGLNSRSLGLVAAAAGRSQPADGSMLNVGPMQQHPAVATTVVAPAPDTGAAGALNRQVQLEQALLEQSVWVQKLAAEVQVRARPCSGLPDCMHVCCGLSYAVCLLCVLWLGGISTLAACQFGLLHYPALLCCAACRTCAPASGWACRLRHL
jgi:hypothetical protein